jgi:hypothetical protein
MDTTYETVVDPADIIGSLLGMGIHALLLVVQLALAVFLIVSGAHALLLPGGDGPWLRRLGVTDGSGPAARRIGAFRLVLGTALLLPLALGAPFLVSLVASLGAFVLLVTIERGLEDRARGRWVRTAAIGSSALVAAFILWEQDDALDLGVTIAANAVEWRVHEREWQLDNDRRSPKMGDLAPDFELQDPSGHTAVRLSSFRGKRPVALVFGSYT